MFRMADVGQVWWPVALTRAIGPDEVEEATVHVLYRIYDREELQALDRSSAASVAEQLAADSAGGGGAKANSADDLLAMIDRMIERANISHDELMERALDWRGVCDASDEEIPFTRERLEALCRFKPLQRAFLGGLMEASRKAPEKNSSPGPGSPPGLAQG